MWKNGSVCAKKLCFSSVKSLVNARSRSDLQEVLGISALRFAAGGVGVVWDEEFSSPTSLPRAEVTSRCRFTAGRLVTGRLARAAKWMSRARFQTAPWVLAMVPCPWRAGDWVRLAFWVCFKIILIFCSEYRLLDWESAYIVGSCFFF